MIYLIIKYYVVSRAGRNSCDSMTYMRVISSDQSTLSREHIGMCLKKVDLQLVKVVSVI